MKAALARGPIVCRIQTQRLVLRAFRSEDAPALCRLIADNLDGLRRWMAWAWQEPVPVEAKAKWLASLRRSTLSGATQCFGVFTPDEAQLLGSVGTHPRIGAGAREIGYWIGAAHQRRGYISEAAAALTKIGFELQRLRRMEIHTDPDNAASVGVARKLAMREQTVVRACMLSPVGPVRDTTIWALTREQYLPSPTAAAAIEAFDRHGRRVL